MRGSPAVPIRTSLTGSFALLAIGAMLALSGCTTDAPGEHGASPEITATGTSASEPSPAPPTAPVFHPDGTAQDNLPLFSAVVAQVWAGEGRVAGRAYVDALTAAGFARADMQVTADESTVGNPAESIQFSVRWQDQCLVGQVGPSTGDPVTAVLPQLDGGRCLIGRTVPVEP